MVIPIKEGEIRNEGYPGYENNLDCTWRWEESEGETISLRLFDVDLLYSVNCSTDYITIQNGRELDSPVIARLCGNRNDSANNFFISSGPFMRLKFITGNVVNRTSNRGFRIRFTTRSEGKIKFDFYPTYYLIAKIW